MMKLHIVTERIRYGNDPFAAEQRTVLRERRAAAQGTVQVQAPGAIAGVC